jgi:hypothetical protein
MRVTRLIPPEIIEAGGMKSESRAFLSLMPFVSATYSRGYRRHFRQDLLETFWRKTVLGETEVRATRETRTKLRIGSERKLVRYTNSISLLSPTRLCSRGSALILHHANCSTEKTENP